MHHDEPFGILPNQSELTGVPTWPDRVPTYR